MTRAASALPAASGWECHDCSGTGIWDDDHLCSYCEGWGWFLPDGSPGVPQGA